MARVESYDLVVVGNEPQGQWLLSQYVSLLQHTAPGRAVRKSPTEGAAVLWLRFPGELPKVYAPQFLIDRYALPEKDMGPIGIVTPERRFDWTSAFFREEWGWDLSDPAQRSSKGIASQAFRHPDSTGFAQGLWEYFGRSDLASANQCLLTALEATKTGFVSYEGVVVPGVQTVPLALSPTSLQFENAGKDLQAQVEGFGTIRSKRWVFAGNLQNWETLTSESSTISLPAPSLKGTTLSRVGFKLSLPTHTLNLAMPSLTFLFDSETIPDPKQEVWILEKRNMGPEVTELCLWVGGLDRKKPDLSHVQGGIERLKRVFPYLAKEAIPAPDCDKALIRERYALSTSYTQTSHPALSYLGPGLLCHLPYPQGPLEGAKTLLKAWYGNRVNRARPAAITAG